MKGSETGVLSITHSSNSQYPDVTSSNPRYLKKVQFLKQSEGGRRPTERSVYNFFFRVLRLGIEFSALLSGHDYPLFRPTFSCRPYSCPPYSCRDRFVPRRTYSCLTWFMSNPFHAQYDRFMSDPIHVHLFMSDPIHVWPHSCPEDRFMSGLFHVGPHSCPKGPFHVWQFKWNKA